ncbi:MAG: transposase [Cytophagaceae bacterium]|nr:MAG: transposase [Cytophagaceae bacterium]
MKQGKWSEEQIIGILKQVEGGRPVAEVCREHSVSQATYYKWKSKYAGLEVNEARRLKQLEDENAKLKRLVADLTLDKMALKDALSKTGEARRQAPSRQPLYGDLQLVAAAGL